MSKNQATVKEVEKVEFVENVTSEAKNSDSFKQYRERKGFVGFVFRHWATIAALIYLVFPIDLLPDFLPGIGYIDDLLALSFTLYQEYKNYKATQEQQ